MKNLITIFSFIILVNSICYSQLPNSYPFKTALDDQGNLYVTGDSINPTTNTHFFVVKKISGGAIPWTKAVENSEGDTKGLDIVIDSDGNPIATGYKFNLQTYSYDLFLIKCNRGSGNEIWSKTYSTIYDEKGTGIAVDINRNVYVTGYTTNDLHHKNILTLKYDQLGILQWSREYNNPVYKNNDEGMDILVDSGFVYVVGNTVNDIALTTDIVLLNYDLNGNNPQANIHLLPKTNEIPTSFIISKLGKKIEKSRISITSVSDNTGGPYQKSNYLTLDFTGGQNLDFHWSRIFLGTGLENIATAIAADENGDVYVTGYSYSNISNYDYATIKYLESDGSNGWKGKDSVLYYDIGKGIDKASSIKVFGDSIYVSGSSQFYPGGFRTISYRKRESKVELYWDDSFLPTFAQEISSLNKAAVLNIDKSTGNIIVMTFGWDDKNASDYAVRGYSSDGTILYTMDYGELTDNLVQTYNRNSGNINSSYSLSQNYPNPFNPSTIISYTLKDNSEVSLKVYDNLGKEVLTLVNQKQGSGNYSVNFNGSKLSSGIYFYKLTADGNIIDTKRMTLIK